VLKLGYFGIAFLMFFENIFPPIPSEPVMLFAGFLVQQKQLTLIGVLLAGTIGSLIGAYALYFLGAWADDHLLRKFLNRFGRYISVSTQDLDRTISIFDRYGQSLILFGRIIPVVRSLISIPAGISHMNLRLFTLYTLIGTLIWNFSLGYAGMFVGANWVDILEIIDRYEPVILFSGLTALTILIVYRVKTNSNVLPVRIQSDITREEQD
jgi:membrane protein DedA with SNARE-associated domain